MSEPAIKVENLSKRYVIGHQGDSRDALRHRIDAALRNPFRWLRQSRERRQASREEFWALNDVSFEVQRGDVVGIIGRNGAGKSTLLKILSRITEPTRGRIELDGRVASLLEVGTGFHQELTGRENIFLNGAILGMTRAEIKRKFDEIVAFSEIEKFLDTSVKRYSSGMYVRLAFAVAAHLEPEILVVDEVLAVGDAAFQKKCLGKMGEVAHGGRTVLFVSHNMAAVQALCRKALYLKSGRVMAMGDVQPLLKQYMAETDACDQRRFSAPVQMGESLKLVTFDVPSSVTSGEPLKFRLSFRAGRAVALSDLSLLFYSSLNTRLALVDLRSLGLPATIPAGETWTVQGEIKSLPLVEGDYSLGLTVNTGEFCENVLDLTGFTVTAREREDGIAPYAVMYRGNVELQFNGRASLQSRSSASADVIAA